MKVFCAYSDILKKETKRSPDLTSVHQQVYQPLPRGCEDHDLIVTLQHRPQSEPLREVSTGIRQRALRFSRDSIES